MEYTVVYAEAGGVVQEVVADLIEQVNEMIQKGWRPLGGISYDLSGIDTFCQAMIKD